MGQLAFKDWKAAWRPKGWYLSKFIIILFATLKNNCSISQVIFKLSDVYSYVCFLAASLKWNHKENDRGWQRCSNLSTARFDKIKVKISNYFKLWLKQSCKVGLKCFIVCLKTLKSIVTSPKKDMPRSPSPSHSILTHYFNIFIETLKYKRHSSPSLYSCLFFGDK